MKTVADRLARRVLWGATLALVASVVAACTEFDSATNLNPEGPPMVRQVRMFERFADAVSPEIIRSRRVFAFGTHPLATGENDAHPVTSARALNNSLRVIMDELLVGNNLEEIACRGQVTATSRYSRVPLGATPDDIARCSAADDVLTSLCSGPSAVCLCENPDGCLRGTTTVPVGQPVGVDDLNQDGAADDTRFIAGAVGIRCGTIDVPLNLDASYWNPSGDQNRPASGGFDALGPALVLVPEVALPTNLPCNLTFADDVVDKQGDRVCAPANGDITLGCTQGDLSAFEFRVEALQINPASFGDNQTGVGRTIPVTLAANAPLASASVAGVTIMPPPTGAVTITNPMPNIIRIDTVGGLDAMTQYTISVPVTVTDSFGQPLPAARSYTFTTGN